MVSEIPVNVSEYQCLLYINFHESIPCQHIFRGKETPLWLFYANNRLGMYKLSISANTDFLGCFCPGDTFRTLDWICYLRTLPFCPIYILNQDILLWYYWLWCRRLTTCRLYVSPIIENVVLNDSCVANLDIGILFRYFLLIYIYTYFHDISWYINTVFFVSLCYFPSQTSNNISFLPSTTVFPYSIDIVLTVFIIYNSSRNLV